MYNESAISNPFPGLRAFEEDEDVLFFGREKQVDELLTKLRTTRFLAVIGSSGSGKSSLVKSGLIPALHSGFMSGAGSLWRICSFRPGNDPVGNMARALASKGVLNDAYEEEETATHAAINESILRRSSNGLVEAYRQSGIDPKNNLLILVDQFEELFRFSKYEIEAKEGKRDSVAFINLLLKATKQTDIPVYVVFTMRSDFLSDCTEFRGLPEAINEGDYLVPRMTREERREAITGPIAVANGKISQRLLNQLLNDVGDNPDQLPILQHALMRTWNVWKKKNRPGSEIDFADYEEIGTMKHALSQHAEEAYAELHTDNERRICEVIFKALTDKGSDTRGIRRPSRMSELCRIANASFSEVAAVIEVFRKQGRAFLMPPANVPLTESSIIDISHESIMRVWEKLILWVDEENQSAQVYLRLCEAADLYEKGNGGLWRDPELQVAWKWREEQRPNEIWASRYNNDFHKAMAFL
ncbi:MAG TPA: AAA family ATPase, partial [Sediminibacterium sp.]